MEILPIFQGEIDKLYVPYAGPSVRKFGSGKFKLMGTYLYEGTAKAIAKQINMDSDWSIKIIPIVGGFALYMHMKKQRKPGRSKSIGKFGGQILRIPVRVKNPGKGAGIRSAKLNDKKAEWTKKDRD